MAGWHLLIPPVPILMHLDVNTMLVMGSFVAIAALGFLFVLCHDADRSRLNWWVAVAVMAILTFVTPLGRSSSSAPVVMASNIGSNVFGVAAFACLLAAIGKMIDRRFNILFLVAGPVLLALTHLVPWVYQSPDLRRIATALISLGYMGLATALFGASLRTPGRPKPGFHEQMIFAVLLFHVAATVVRAGLHFYAFRTGLVTVSAAAYAINIIESVCAGILLLGAVLGYEMRGIRSRLEEQAATDPLTGVLNRRAFLARLTKDIEVDAVDGTLVMFDLDHFKRINDTFGHAVGDRVLSDFTRIARTSLGDAGYFGRLGGEEFACFIPQAAAAPAIGIAEDIRWTLMGRALLSTHTVTVSIGMASTREAGHHVKRLVDFADRALYRSKNAGRNRISEHIEPGMPRSTPAPHYQQTA